MNAMIDTATGIPETDLTDPTAPFFSATAMAIVDRIIEDATRVLRWWKRDLVPRTETTLAAAVEDIGRLNRREGLRRGADLLRDDREIRQALLSGAVLETPYTRWQIG